MILVPSLKLDVIAKAVGEASPAAEVFFRQEGTRVFMIVNRARVLDLPWTIADQLARSIKRVARNAPGQPILVIADGRTILDVPGHAVGDVLTAFVSRIRDAEEIEAHDQIATDAAILLRAGVPMGLTDHPVIRDEAAKRAAWDSDLRRYMPGGVRGSTLFGRPGVRRTSPESRTEP